MRTKIRSPMKRWRWISCRDGKYYQWITANVATSPRRGAAFQYEERRLITRGRWHRSQWFSSRPILLLPSSATNQVVARAHLLRCATFAWDSFSRPQIRRKASRLLSAENSRQVPEGVTKNASGSERRSAVEASAAMQLRLRNVAL